MAKWLMIAGAVLLVAGILLTLFPNGLSWFGKLPGDIRIETENSGFYMPITSMVIISLVLTLLLNLINRL